MKKIVVFLLCFSVFSFFAEGLFAQKEVKWASYRIAFSSSADFKIVVNEEDEFQAESKDFVVSIFPDDEEEVSLDILATATIAMANQMGYEDVGEATEIKLADYKGFYVEGNKDGASAIVMSLLDAKSSVNMIIMIDFAAGLKEQAMAIAQSIRSYK